MILWHPHFSLWGEEGESPVFGSKKQVNPSITWRRFPDCKSGLFEKMR
jgi:hypothetical protein